MTNWNAAGTRDCCTNCCHFDLDEFNIWDVPQTKALLDQKIGVV